MRILVDPEIFFYGRCGMVRYYSSLCNAFEQAGCIVDLPLVASCSDFISGRFQFLNKLRCRIPNFLFRRITDVLSKRWYYYRLRKGGHDVVLVTSPVFEDTFLKHIDGAPFVMVVHDTMRGILGPDGFFDPAGGNIDRLAYLSCRAAKVICVSKATQNDLLALCDVEKVKTAVIYTGNLLEAAPRRPEGRLPEKYLLFVGERTGRKNFRFLAKSIAAVLERQRDVFLVCTGKFSPWEMDLLERLGISQQCIAIDADDGLLLHLYQNALCLLYPTLYEGFGLPVLEAMANECPVITADTGSVREVGGDAVEYVDPLDSDAIAQKVKELLERPFRRQYLAECGLDRAQLFSRQAMIQSFLAELSNITVIR